MNNVLFIDLTAKTFKTEEIPQEIMRKFIGGRGLGAKLLYDLVNPDIDPLSPDNALIFTVGPLQGSGVPFTARTQLITKSPQTGIYLYSNAGGTMGIRMRECGLAALVITGKSDKPIYLQIYDNDVKFKDASSYWGLLSSDSQRLLLEDLKTRDVTTAVIGPAGENLLRNACVVTEGDRRRTFGRGGAGAVFGSKMLKGLAIKGSRKIEKANSELVSQAIKQIAGIIREKQQWRKARMAYGTLGSIETNNKVGMLPTRNWKQGVFENADNLSGTVYKEKYAARNTSCGPYCMAPCSKIAIVREGEYAGYSTEGPEYETAYAFGSNCNIDRYDAIIAADRICDELGIDTLSAGLTIGFAMECYERGLINNKDTGGIELRFGSHQVIPELLNQMAYRRGFGAILADGVKMVSERIGQGSEDFAMHSKGMEFGGYECRGYYGQALAFALSNRGGCHHDLGLPVRAELDGTGRNIKGKGEIIKKAAITRIMYDNSIMCTFVRTIVGKDPLATAISGMLGEDISVKYLEEAALRTLNLERCFNVLTGVRRQHDRLPKRLLEEPLEVGPNIGAVVPLEELKDEFYEFFGWDNETGIPIYETLQQLGLGKEAEKLTKLS